LMEEDLDIRVVDPYILEGALKMLECNRAHGVEHCSECPWYLDPKECVYLQLITKGTDNA